MAKYVLKLNSNEKIEQLGQEVYDQVCQTIKEVQESINKINNNVNLVDATIEERTKFAKAMNDFSNTKLKAIQAKFDLAKFLGEIVKHNNSLADTLNDNIVGKNTTLDIEGWRNAVLTDDPKPQVYDLK